MIGTPLYDALLGERLAPLRAVAALHDGAPGEPCGGCGLDSPCPSARVVGGELTAEQARVEVRRERVARAVAASTPAPAPAGVSAATDAATDAGTDARTDAGTDDAGREGAEPERPLPVLPSAAELFAPNPGTSRALDALLGGPARV